MLNAEATRMAHELVGLQGLRAAELGGQYLGSQAGANQQLASGPVSASHSLISRTICANLSHWAASCALTTSSQAPANPNVNISGLHMYQAQGTQSIDQNMETLNRLLALGSDVSRSQFGQNILASQQTMAAASPLTNLVTNHLLEPTRALETKLDYYFSDIWLTSGDERTNKLPFIGAGPWKLLWATSVYLLLIKWLLPRLMRPFKPFELNWPIRVYNFLMVLSNMWAFYHGARILNFGRKCFGCETINHRDYSAQSLELLHYGWLFLVSRLVEWLDTIFFVLRKRERQVTKLHVFHHSFVPLISWTYLKYHPGYTVAFFPFVNSFVHSIMYTYYLLATFGPKIQPYLWWKRYLTSLQIAQFILIIIQLASIPLTGDETCQYPRGFLYVAFAGASLFLWLFFTYYIDTYSKSRRNSKHINSNTDIKQRQQQNGFLLGYHTATRQHGGKQREGSSTSLSDAIDDAICCETATTCSSAKKFR